MNVWNTIKNSRQYIYLSSLGVGFWAFLIITMLIGFITVFYVEDMFKFIISSYGYIGIFLIVLAIELLVQPTGPDLIMMLGLVATLNPWIVLILVLISAHLSFYIAYVIGRRIGAAGVEKITGKKSFNAITTSTLTSGKWFMFLSSFTPIPYIPYLAGVWNFNFRECITYVIIPRTVRLLIVFVLIYFLGIKLLDLSISSLI